MSIDWSKVEENPKKKHSVEGRILLDFRVRNEDLEQRINQLVKELEMQSEDLGIVKKKLVGREKSLIQLTEKRSTARKSFDKIKEEKLHTDIKITQLTAAKSDLEKQRDENIKKITTLEGQLKTNAKNSEEFGEKIVIKERQLQTKEEEMLNKTKDLLTKEKEIQNMNSLLDQRNKEIDFLKKNLEVEKGKTSYQIKRVESIEAQIAKSESILSIIKKIKDLIDVKGFLSDKEFEPLLNEIID